MRSKPRVLIDSDKSLGACRHGNTPVAYNKLARGASFLFESVQGGERWGRYSIIGLPASRWLSATRHQVKTYQGDDLIECVDTSDPLATIDAMRSAYRSAPIPHLPVFHGGWVGYFSYDTVGFVESDSRITRPEMIWHARHLADVGGRGRDFRQLGWGTDHRH